MTQVNLPYRPAPQSTEDITQILADFDAILSVINGDIRDDNVNAAAAISVAKLAAGAAGQVLGMRGGVPVWSGGWQKIEDKVVAAPVGNLDFAAIPAEFAHLKLLIQVRSSFAVALDALRMRINGDATASYDNAFSVTTDAPSSVGGGAPGETSAFIGSIVGSTGPADEWSQIELTILDYTKAGTVRKGGNFHSFGKSSEVAGGLQSHVGGFRWRNPAAINSLNIFPGAGGNIVVGSRATLYGIG